MTDKQNKMDRRSFFKAAGAAGLGSVFVAKHGQAENEPGAAKKTEQTKYPQVPVRKLGKTGADVPILSLGAMFNVAENQMILTKCLQWGVNYWDTANSYVGGMSEHGIGKFLSKNPGIRKDLFIVTKASRAETIEEVEERLQISLKRMKTNYIDLYYGVHALKTPDGLTDELKQWAASAKKRKLIRFFGISTHKNMAECLSAASKLDWIDAIMTSYNFRLMQKPEMQAAIEACHKANIGLVAMKVQGRGQKIETEGDKKLAGDFLQSGFTPGQAKIKVVLEDKRISSVCTKMQNVAMLTSNVAAVLDKTTLSSADKAAFQQYADANCDGYCAGCANICTNAVANGQYVSDIMRYLMYYNSYGDKSRAKQLFARIPAKVRTGLLKADYSIAEARCPQKLAITKLLAEAVNKLA